LSIILADLRGQKGYPYTDEDKAALHLDGDLDANYHAAVKLVLMEPSFRLHFNAVLSIS